MDRNPLSERLMPTRPQEVARRALAGLGLALTFPATMLSSTDFGSSLWSNPSTSASDNSISPEVVRSDFPVPDGVSVDEAERWYHRGHIWQSMGVRAFLPLAYTLPFSVYASQGIISPPITLLWPERRGIVAYESSGLSTPEMGRRYILVYMNLYAPLDSHEPERLSVLTPSQFGYRGPELNHVENVLPRTLQGPHDSFVVKEIRETESPWSPGQGMLRVLRDDGGLVFIECSPWVRYGYREIPPSPHFCTMRMVRSNLMLQAFYPTVFNHSEVHDCVSRLHAAMRLSNT